MTSLLLRQQRDQTRDIARSPHYKCFDCSSSVVGYILKVNLSVDYEMLVSNGISTSDNTIKHICKECAHKKKET
jgi:hypothetical protein